MNTNQPPTTAPETPPEAQPVPQQAIRACLSNDLGCTGINPCGLCARQLFEQLMPKALYRAGFITAQNRAQVQTFFDAYAAEWMAMLTAMFPNDVVTKAPHNKPLTGAMQPAAPAMQAPTPIAGQLSQKAPDAEVVPPEPEPEPAPEEELPDPVQGLTDEIQAALADLPGFASVVKAPAPSPEPLPAPPNLPPIDDADLANMAEAVDPSEVPMDLPELASDEAPSAEHAAPLADEKARAVARRARLLRSRMNRATTAAEVKEEDTHG